MVQNKNFRKSKMEIESQCKIDFCEECPFYECELVEEYLEFRKNHPSNNKPSDNESTSTVSCMNPDFIKVTIADEDDSEEMFSLINDQEKEPDSCIVTLDDSGKRLAMSYEQEGESKKGCIINQRYVEKIECGMQRVAEGIGEHYKIETDWEHKIEEKTDDRWEPSQAVFISAQTGQGKNYFIENTLMPYVRELNYKKRQSRKS